MNIRLKYAWVFFDFLYCSKPLCGSKIGSGFSFPEVDQMSTRNIWKNKLSLSSGSAGLV